MRDRLYSKVTKEDAEDLALIATREEREEIKRIKNEMREIYLKAVEMGLDELEIIQKTYENYVGEPMNNP